MGMHLRKMLALRQILVFAFLLPVVSCIEIDWKTIPCPYPIWSSIEPCSCKLQAEVEMAWDDRNWRGALLGTFRKRVTCVFEETFNFSRIAQAFEHDNRIYELTIKGQNDGDFFLEGLGRLNITILNV